MKCAWGGESVRGSSAGGRERAGAWDACRAACVLTIHLSRGVHWAFVLTDMVQFAWDTIMDSTQSLPSSNYVRTEKKRKRHWQSSGMTANRRAGWRWDWKPTAGHLTQSWGPRNTEASGGEQVSQVRPEEWAQVARGSWGKKLKVKWTAHAKACCPFIWPVR